MRYRRLGAVALAFVIALIAPSASSANHVDDRTAHVVVTSAPTPGRCGLALAGGALDAALFVLFWVRKTI